MWNLSSRVHSLNHFPKQSVNCYVKRDDELSCGISGSKLRKYASLIPYLQISDISHLIIIAGPQSNNLLAALQMAREFQLRVTAFLIKPRTLKIQGNFALSRLFLADQDIIWVERDDWNNVEKTAQDYANSCNKSAFILNEGASVPEALPGALSLAQDLIVNEQHLNLTFQHIFVDAGTGFSAAALIKGLAQLNHPAQIHILLLADDAVLFNKKLKQWVGGPFSNFDCFYPTNAKSFGSVNNAVKQSIKRMACEEGILVDPIYSAKLFYESRQFIEEKRLQGNVLIIHSGGLLTMSGFSDLC